MNYHYKKDTKNKQTTIQEFYSDKNIENNILL